MSRIPSTGGVCVVAGGVCMVAGGHVWLLGVCVVALEHAWLPGGMHGCWGACMVAGGGAWLLGGVRGCGGVHGCRGCIGYDEIRSMSGWYASYWNAFLFHYKNRQSAQFLIENRRGKNLISRTCRMVSTIWQKINMSGCFDILYTMVNITEFQKWNQLLNDVAS